LGCLEVSKIGSIQMFNKQTGEIEFIGKIVIIRFVNINTGRDIIEVYKKIE